DRWPAALLVADENTRDALGARLADVQRARGVNVREVVFPQRTGLLADHPAVDRTRAALDGASLPVAVGAGVITDIVRYAAHLEQRDFLSVPTAASMDGYASSVAALQVDGVKVTYPARAP